MSRGILTNSETQLADFGNAQEIPEGPIDLRTKLDLRRKATRGYYTPVSLRNSCAAQVFLSMLVE